MYAKRILATLAAISSLAVGQNITGLPACATGGLANALAASGCNSTDVSCICRSSAFITSLDQYANTNCSPEDHQKATVAGQSACAQAGVTLNTTTTASTSSTTTMTTSASYIVNGTLISASTTSSGNVSTTATATATRVGDVTIITTTRCSCTVETLTVTPTTSTPIATYTGAAARDVGQIGRVAFGGLVGVVGGLALL